LEGFKTKTKNLFFAYYVCRGRIFFNAADRKIFLGTQRMIYLDNSATSGTKPDCVTEAVLNTMRYANGNPGRGGHFRSAAAAKIVQEARENAARFFGNPCPDRCVFTGSCTEALNLAVFGAVSNVAQKKKRILTTVMEHNSVLRPLNMLSREQGFVLNIACPDHSGRITADIIRKKLCPDTALVAVTHIGNVLGAENPIREIAELCRERKVLFLSDCAQSAGYSSINMKRDAVDMIAVPAHKGLYGPQGVGMLLVNEHVRLSPLIFGGTGTDTLNPVQSPVFPEGFEAGTLPTPAIAGMNAGIDYVRMQNGEIRKKTRELSTYFFEKLKCLNSAEVYSSIDSQAGIVTFNLIGRHSGDLASTLSKEYCIAVRGGLHCAPLVHKYLGTEKRGAVRVSFSFKNTKEEADSLLSALKELGIRN
jgi:cysteine desulfurase family protein